MLVCPAQLPGLAALLLALTAPAAWGDVFHLKSGGMIEGELLEITDNHYQIQIASGQVRVPIGAVERVEESESSFQEYERQRAAAPDTAAGQFALAQWCAENGYAGERRKHLRRVLQLDREHEGARRALGFIRIGGFWVEGRTRERASATAPATEDDPARLEAAIRVQWTRKLRAWRAAYLDSRDDALFERGVEQLRTVRDPLAIIPLIDVLGGGDVRLRRLMIDAVSKYDVDEATLNLTVIALFDPAPEIRTLAITELVRRDDPRILGQLRAALQSQNEALIRRAAIVLGEMHAREAVPQLIGLLRARQERGVDVPVNVYLGTLTAAFSGPTQIDLGGGARIVHGPALASGNLSDNVINVRQQQIVTVFRSEVLDALRSITGKDFGFDQNQWAAWLQEQQR